MTYFLKINKDTVVNESKIIWVKKMGDILHFCTNKNGCIIDKKSIDTIKCDKKTDPEEFNYLCKNYGFT